MPEGGATWVAAAAETSGLPEWWLARIIERESDWRPDIYAPDINGGTWGLFQINRSEWARFHPGASGTPPTGITDPIVHSQTAGQLFREHYDRFVSMAAASPDTAWAKLDPLTAVVIMHNAGEGSLRRYPYIPDITKSYVAEVMAGADDAATTCTDSGFVSAEGWARPSDGSFSSAFGMRFHPIYGTWRLHSGTDLSSGCGGPIYAAQDGVVTMASFDGNGNGTIILDHGGGVTTRYLHMEASGFLVRPGDVVKAGQVIAREGSSGQSTGCHLHFEVRIDENPVDPVPFMAERGVNLR